jgi:hypothetical protein
MSKKYYENWDEKAPDLNELKAWWADDVRRECPGYGNHHEWHTVCGIPKEKFTEVVRALKEAEEKKLYGYEIVLEEGKNGLLYLQVNTAKDYDGELMDFVCQKCGITDFLEYPRYFEDAWDTPEDCMFPDPSRNLCELVSLTIESEVSLNDEETYDEWDVRYVVRDIKTGMEAEFGGGYIDRDQAIALWENAKAMNKADDYKESLDPDIEYLTDPPEPEME